MKQVSDLFAVGFRQACDLLETCNDLCTQICDQVFEQVNHVACALDDATVLSFTFMSSKTLILNSSSMVTNGAKRPGPVSDLQSSVIPVVSSCWLALSIVTPLSK